jgi:hypothetical protein
VLNYKREVGNLTGLKNDAQNRTEVLLSGIDKEIEDSDDEEDKYRLFSRTGMVRALKHQKIDIEDVPFKKKRKRSKEKPKTQASERDQIQELFDMKAKLARRGIRSDLKEIEFGIMDTGRLSEFSKLPEGGENLMNNPFIVIKSQSKKKKKKKKKGKST